MSRVCELSGKSSLVGNRVSHSNVKSKHRFLPNLQKRRFWSPKLSRFVTVKVSTSAIRNIDKLGFDQYCAQANVKV